MLFLSFEIISIVINEKSWNKYYIFYHIDHIILTHDLKPTPIHIYH